MQNLPSPTMNLTIITPNTVEYIMKDQFSSDGSDTPSNHVMEIEARCSQTFWYFS
jgi:hypothetical protein